MGYPFRPPNGYEERLNRQFSGYLHYSLQIGPELLNRVHENQSLSFSDKARLVAHQDSPLPRYTETGPNREIDWVVRDEDKLVGYESKYGDSLGRSQLQDELSKLEVNADGRDAVLVAVTPHTTRPGIIDRLETEQIRWMSWNTVSRKLHQTDEAAIQPEQRPLLRMLQDLFEAEDMHPFTGFDHRDKLQYRYFIRDLRQELVDSELENPGKVHTSTTKSSEPSTWKRLVPKRLDIPFVRTSRDEDWKRQRSYLTATVDTETHKIHTGVVFNLRGVGPHQEYVAERLDDLVAFAAERELQLWASMNSFNQWKVGIAQTDDPDEMRSWLESGSKNVVRANGTDYKKAIFVRECAASTPSDLVQETKEGLLEFHEKFLVDDELYPWPTLEGHE